MAPVHGNRGSSGAHEHQIVSCQKHARNRAIRRLRDARQRVGNHGTEHRKYAEFQDAVQQVTAQNPRKQADIRNSSSDPGVGILQRIAAEPSQQRQHSGHEQYQVHRLGKAWVLPNLVHLHGRIEVEQVTHTRRQPPRIKAIPASLKHKHFDIAALRHEAGLMTTRLAAYAC